MLLHHIVVGQLEVNCYIIASAPGKGAIIIDPGSQIYKIKEGLEKHRLKAAMVINTHGHIDHIGCDDDFGAPIYIHRSDEPLLKDPHLNLSGFLGLPFTVKTGANTLEEGQEIGIDDIRLKVIHIPGHTPGGISLLLKSPVENILFTGDSLFCRSIGRTDFDGADEVSLKKSIKEKLFKLPPETIIYPGHGPTSTIKEEKENNLFLS